MQSLHENFAPQILVFRHELPFFPSYFVWNPFCFCRGLVFVVDLFCCGFVFDLILTFSVSAVESFLFLSWMPLCIFLLSFYFSLFSLLPCSFNFLLRNPKNVGVFLEKVQRFSEKVHRFLEATL